MKRLSIFLSTIFLLIGIFAGCSAMGVAPVTGFYIQISKPPLQPPQILLIPKLEQHRAIPSLA